MARVNKTRRMQVKRKEEKNPVNIQKEVVSERETRSAKKQKLEAKFVPEELQVMQDVDVVFPYELAEKILTEEGIDQPMVIEHFNKQAIRDMLEEEEASIISKSPLRKPAANVVAIVKLHEAKEKILAQAEEAAHKHLLQVKQELFWLYKYIERENPKMPTYTVEDIENAVEKAKLLMMPSSQDNLALWRALNKD